jgi:hypothetical protein
MAEARPVQAHESDIPAVHARPQPARLELVFTEDDEVDGARELDAAVSAMRPRPVGRIVLAAFLVAAVLALAAWIVLRALPG